MPIGMTPVANFEIWSGQDTVYVVNDNDGQLFDFEKLARTFPALELEWTAQRGAAELLEAYRAAGLDTAAFDGDLYVRLRRLHRLVEGGEVDGSFRRL